MTMVRVPQWMLREHVRDNDDELEMMEECGCEMEAARLRRICRVQNEFMRHIDVKVARRRARLVFKQEADPFEAMVAPYHQEPPIPPKRRRRIPPELMNPKAVVPPEEKPPKPTKPAKPKTRKPAKPKRKKRHMSTATATAGYDYFTSGSTTSGGGKAFKVCPDGSHAAVIVGLIAIGTHKDKFAEEEEKPKQQALILLHLDPSDPELVDQDGHPFAFFLQINLQRSYGPKAKARLLLGEALGRELPDGEPCILKEMLGKNVIAKITHSKNGDRTYANLKTFSAYNKKMEKFEPVVPTFVCRPDEAPPDYEWMPRWFGKTVEEIRMQSIEYKEANGIKDDDEPNLIHAHVMLQATMVASGKELHTLLSSIDRECRTTLVAEATDYIKAMQWGDRLVGLDEAQANTVYGKALAKLDPSKDAPPWGDDPTKSEDY